MEPKKIISLFTIVGATVGGYIPALWGDDMFSFTSLLFGAAGAMAGIYVGFKLTR